MARANTSAKGVFGSLKSKLGFSDAQEEYDDNYYGYDDEEGYDEGDYDDYDNGDDGEPEEYRYDSGYEGSPRNRAMSRGSSNHANLVSIDDVRAHTQVPDRLNRDPLPAHSAQGQRASESNRRSSSRFGRQVERASDYLRSTETSDLVNSPAQASGVDSLFSATASAAKNEAGKSFDPYDAYEGSGAATHNPTRSLSVIKPAAYGDVEHVAKILKVGDVVVLSLKNTSATLSKRILDFSFGVASALDASVECIADKVFVIIRGNALSPEELTALRNQGVI